MNPFNRIAIATAVAAIADLLTKRLIVSHLELGEKVTLIPQLLWLTYVHNYRGAMGLFGDRQIVLILLAVLALGALAFMLAEIIRRSARAQVAFGMIVGGAVANLIDRIAHGYVVDYVAARGFYVFNVADACITVGAVAIFLVAFQYRRAGLI